VDAATLNNLDTNPGWHLVLGIAMAGAAVAAMAVVRNRFMRRRLLFTLVLSVAFLLVHVLRLGLGSLTGVPSLHDLETVGRLLEVLLAALGIVNLLVTLACNPWFRDGTIERAPSIVQDAIVIAAFGSIGIFVLRDKIAVLAASGIVAATIGFALQDTLANLFAGLGIQIDRPFRVGQWITVGSYEGLVTAVTWRATKIRTKLGNLVILPNNLTAKEAITNYSEPLLPTRLIVDVGAAYQVPPNEVRDAISSVLSQSAHVLETPPAEVLLYDFGASAVTYRSRFWINDFNLDETVKDAVRRGIYYEFKRRGIEIPWPIQVRYHREEPPADSPERRAGFARAIAKVPVLAPLANEVHEALAGAAEERLYGDGEVIVREGDGGSSMFIVQLGAVVVAVGPERKEVARIEAGGYFGEMSLLTGAPRSATVTAKGDCDVLEISADTFRTYVHTHPEVVEPLAAAADARRRELDRTRAAARTDAGPSAVSIAHRIREFFGLS
jgi:small-conductance mechanosensitive channel/CRP-like cAMP-binding protein